MFNEFIFVLACFFLINRKSIYAKHLYFDLRKLKDVISFDFRNFDSN